MRLYDSTIWNLQPVKTLTLKVKIWLFFFTLKVKIWTFKVKIMTYQWTFYLFSLAEMGLHTQEILQTLRNAVHQLATVHHNCIFSKWCKYFCSHLSENLTVLWHRPVTYINAKQMHINIPECFAQSCLINYKDTFKKLLKEKIIYVSLQNKNFKTFVFF